MRGKYLYYCITLITNFFGISFQQLMKLLMYF